MNSMRERLSIATFHSAKMTAELGPAPSLINPENPPLFRTLGVGKVFENFFSRKLLGKSNLEFMRIDYEEEGNATAI